MANHIPDIEDEKRRDFAGLVGMMAVSASDRGQAVGRFCPPSRLRRFGAASFACQKLAWFTEPKLAEGERRMVDQTGIEPVTS